MVMRNCKGFIAPAQMQAGHRQRRPEHRPEHLPPGRGQPGRASQFLGEREELAVQPERSDRGGGQQVLLAAGHADISS